MLRARRAESQARAEAEAARQTADFVVGMFRSLDPRATVEHTTSVQALLDMHGSLGQAQRPARARRQLRGLCQCQIGMARRRHVERLLERRTDQRIGLVEKRQHGQLAIAQQPLHGQLGPRHERLHEQVPTLVDIADTGDDALDTSARTA